MSGRPTNPEATDPAAVERAVDGLIEDAEHLSTTEFANRALALLFDVSDALRALLTERDTLKEQVAREIELRIEDEPAAVARLLTERDALSTRAWSYESQIDDERKWRAAAEATLTRIRDALPYHGCSVCRGAERGPDGVPCSNCGGAGEEPSLENLVEANLRYLETRDGATLTRYRNEAEERVAAALYERAMEERRTFSSKPEQFSRGWYDEPYVPPLADGESRPVDFRDAWRLDARAALDGPKEDSPHIADAKRIITERHVERPDGGGIVDGPKEEET